MYPGVLLFYPDIAASFLDYRVARLPGSRFKATTYSPPFSGAMFSWESAVSGTELAAAPWGARELHISSDIAAAVWAFWVATQDARAPWLNSTAWPLLEGIATFWMSKLALDNPADQPGMPLSLLDVMGPDEYHDGVADSAYTNAGVIMALTHAASVAALLGVDPGVYGPWLDCAGRIRIPFNASAGYHPEFAGYALGTQVKQADTILLGFPFEFAHDTFSAATRAADLVAYEQVTDAGGPAMTWAMFAVGFIELGTAYAGAAAANFNRSFANAQPPFYVWTETPSGGTPNFLTGAGGWLQAAFGGYTGLRVNASGLFLAPALPEATGTLGLRGIALLGQRLDIDYDARTLTVAVQAAGAAAPAATAARRYADVCAQARAAGGDAEAAACDAALRRGRAAAALSLAPRSDLAQRSQRARVLLGSGHIVAAQMLQLVDAAGGVHALTPGTPIVLPLQPVSVVAASAV